MTYRVRIDPAALRQINQFAVYLRNYGEDFAIEQIEHLDRILRADLAEAPLTWSYFPLTGAPYRAYLFRVGRRTQYWIIYTVDEESRGVDILSFWGTARDSD
jgi:mRNA-degrading endonuclease RelE of RelBE toxin-antitoxin system